MRVKAAPFPWQVKAVRGAPSGNYTGVAFGKYFLNGKLVSREEYLAARPNRSGKPGASERAQAAGKPRDMRHNPLLDEAMDAAASRRHHTPALNALTSQDPRHNPLLDELFDGPKPAAAPTDAGRFPSKFNPEITYGDRGDRDSDDRYFDRKIATAKRGEGRARAQLAEAEARGDKLDALRNDPAAQAEIVRRVQAELAAQRKPKPGRARRDTSHIGRDLFAERAGLSGVAASAPAQSTVAATPSPPGQRGGMDAASLAEKAGLEMAQAAGFATPPPLPHHRTHVTALGAANKLVAAARDGKSPRHVHQAHMDAVLALHEHEREGHKAIDRMARDKYGDSAKGRFLAAKAKREFGQKMTAARQRLAKVAGQHGVRTGRIVKGFDSFTIDLDTLLQVADLEN